MKGLATAALLVGLLAASRPASAQVPGANRPFQGLFGAAKAGGSQTLDLSANLIGAYDDNIYAESGAILPGSPTQSGVYSILGTAGQYGWVGRKVRLGATMSSNWRYYDHVGDVQMAGYSGGLGVSAQLPRKSSLAINQSVSYAPSYLFGLFPSGTPLEPGAAPPVAPDYAVDDAASYAYGTNASLTYGLTRYGSLTVSGDYSLTDFVEQDAGRRDLSFRRVRASYSRAVGRRTGIRTGYGYMAGEFGSLGVGASPTSEHSVEFGVDTARLLSASRQVQFGINVGVSTMESPEDIAGGTPSGRFYRLLGDASVSYQFSRSFVASGSARRGVEYIADLSEPVLVGGFTASLTGLVTRRVDIGLVGGYVSGASALYSTSHFSTWTASAKGRIALTSMLALSVEYLYYVYDFGTGDNVLAPGLPSTLERNGVRLGLTVWMPAFRR